MEIATRPTNFVCIKKHGNVHKLTQTLAGVCVMSPPVTRGEDILVFGRGSGSREIVLLNDNHTVISLLFSGREGVCDDSSGPGSVRDAMTGASHHSEPSHPERFSVFVSGPNVATQS